MHAAAHRKMDGDVEEARREREGLVHFHLDARIRVS
jgi:hypothetical protein